jgi:hypothetical protein
MLTSPQNTKSLHELGGSGEREQAGGPASLGGSY